MVELAVDIVAFCIVAATVVAAVMILGVLCSPFIEWLDAAPGRRRRFWTVVGAGVALPVLLAWYSLSPSGLAAARARVLGAAQWSHPRALRLRARWARDRGKACVPTHRTPIALFRTPSRGRLASARRWPCDAT